ncbi:MAG: pyridoxamine 5'-phosphate oxidase [Fimbriimonadia bacterium]|nr:pyridoxamine 5'-phosphate oxidase [Fimbriimonadia bacterium]
MDATNIRKTYALGELTESEADPNPLVQFERWLKDATQSGYIEPNAMTLATCDSRGIPSARVVLLRGFDEHGFVFYTNYESRKGRELSENPHASLVFWWNLLERQIRIEGRVEKVSEEESNAYFAGRPRGSQIGAWVSEQSQVIEGRETLEQLKAAYEQQFEGIEVPRPPYWGGFRVVPESIEFWQGRRNRLHDRLRYRKTESGIWIIERLSP